MEPNKVKASGTISTKYLPRSCGSSLHIVASSVPCENLQEYKVIRAIQVDRSNQQGSWSGQKSLTVEVFGFGRGDLVSFCKARSGVQREGESSMVKPSDKAQRGEEKKEKGEKEGKKRRGKKAQRGRRKEKGEKKKKEETKTACLPPCFPACSELRQFSNGQGITESANGFYLKRLETETKTG